MGTQAAYHRRMNFPIGSFRITHDLRSAYADRPSTSLRLTTASTQRSAPTFGRTSAGLLGAVLVLASCAGDPPTGANEPNLAADAGFREPRLRLPSFRRHRHDRRGLARGPGPAAQPGRLPHEPRRVPRERPAERRRALPPHRRRARRRAGRPAGAGRGPDGGLPDHDHRRGRQLPRHDQQCRRAGTSSTSHWWWTCRTSRCAAPW